MCMTHTQKDLYKRILQKKGFLDGQVVMMVHSHTQGVK